MLYSPVIATHTPIIDTLTSLPSQEGGVSTAQRELWGVLDQSMRERATAARSLSGPQTFL